MNLLKIVLIIILSFEIGISQTITSKSERINLDIHYGPPDHIPPVVHTNFPKKNIIEDLPIYTKDSVVVFSGNWSDNVDNKLFIFANDSLVHTAKTSAYNFKLNIPYGKSVFNIKFEDFKKNNVSELYSIERNDSIDFIKPEIVLVDPKTRGFKVTELSENDEDSTSESKAVFLVRGFLKDESGIHQLKINNIPISIDTNDFFIWIPESKPDYLSINAIDNYGNETIKFINLSGSANPEGTQVLIGNYHALIIGIQNYNDKNIPSLDFPIDDSKNLIDVLTSEYTFVKENIDFLQDPSRKEIIQALKALRNELSKKDNLLIFFAGHGYWDEDLQQGFWLPRDASIDDDAEWLSNGRVRDYIRAINTKHTLLIADACFSGGIFKSREVTISAPKSIQEMYNTTSRTAMTSGALKEVPDKSVFIEYLAKRLSENNKDYLSSEELFYSLKEAVINNSPVYQTPEYGVIHQSGDEGGGSFIFMKK